MNKMEQLMFEIADWLYMNGDESTRLVFGIWSFSDSPHTYYATINQGDKLLHGESSYGSDSVEDALRCVVDELHGIFSL